MTGSQLTINATRYANAIALVFGAHQFSYAALNERACRLANGLAALGVTRGDHVASLINNCNHSVEMFFALAKLGPFIPINFWLASREVGQLLDDCRPKLLFAGESLHDVVVSLRGWGSVPPQLISVPDRPLHTADIGSPSSYEAFLHAHPAHELL
jgi:fatty-acyl-CoA synthase